MASQAMLEGVRVLDLTTVVFGPYCTRLLADLGADVVKVEPPGGDVFRQAGKPAHTRRMGPCHMSVNRGKRSIVLDLKQEADQNTLRGLIRTADVFIHNVREQAVAKLGFGYEAVRALKPDVIYVHCVGFGEGGPYSGLQAYDDLIQAGSGAATLASRVDGDPTPRYMPSLIADKVAGMSGAYATLGALFHKARTGEGQKVVVPMFEAFTAFLLEEHLFGETFEPPTGPVGYSRQIDPNRQPFPTQDGHISIVPYTDDGWATLFELLGAPETLEDPRFATPVDRAKNASDLYAIVATLTPRRSTAEWERLLRAARVPAMGVRDLADIKDDPHLAATGFFKRREHPTEGTYIEMQPAARFSVRPFPEGRPAPGLNEHADELRAEAGEARRTRR